MLRFLSRLGIRRGLLAGSRGWLALGVVATGLRLIGRIGERQPEVVHRQRLEPGDTIVIEHRTTTWGELRKQRR